MSPEPSTPVPPAPAAPEANPAAAAASSAAPAIAGGSARASAPGASATPSSILHDRRLWLTITAAVLALLAVVALVLSWTAHQRSRQLELTLVARQQQSQTQVSEALLLARQSQDSAREVTAKMALLEAKVAEAAVQRSQLDELIQSLTRSRDENLLADLEAALRVAQQQSALTGSPEPLISTLRQADERLARYNQPRLERVRRAVLRDLERVRGAAVIDVPSLVIRIDEIARQVDDLPLAGTPAGHGGGLAPAQTSAQSAPPSTTPSSAQPAPPTSTGTAPGSGAGAAATPSVPWWQPGRQALDWLLGAGAAVWRETRELVRLSRVDNPEAVLASPDQVFFLRENLKLRLLNARLALLSRQFDLAQSDLRDSQRALQRYFDPASRRVMAAQEQIGQIAQQTRQVSLPRPEDTLAALATVNAGR